ncbi:MAG: S9 family peptidase [Acidobacteriota bacterium]
MKQIIAAAFALWMSTQSAVAQDKLLTLDDLYDPQKKIDFSGSVPSGFRWNLEGTHYLQVRSRRGEGDGAIERVEAATGQSTPLLDRDKFQSALQNAGVPEQDARRISRRTSFQFNESQSAVLFQYASDLFYFEIPGLRAVRLTQTPDTESAESFSPDGKLVAFARSNNLYVVDVQTARERALTTDGSPTRLNGKLDWVYQEELYGRGNYQGYWWSPDSQRLAFLQLDESQVPAFTVIDHIPYRQTEEVTPYPKAGDPNPGVRLAVVPVVGGALRWIDLSSYTPTDALIIRVAWTPDSRKVVFQVQNREQTWLDLNLAPADQGKTQTLLRETTPAWVNENGDPIWLKDGSFLWFSERDGWKHLYHYDSAGKLLRQVTQGPWEVRTSHGVDETEGWIYFSGTEQSHIATHPYRIRLDGSELQRLSPSEGNHQVAFSPTLSYFIDTSSRAAAPAHVNLYDKVGKLVRVIEANQAASDRLKEYRLGKMEFLKVLTRDGFEMEALLIRPPDFDPAKSYPVWSYTYAGPHAPSVRDSWGGVTTMWYHLLAQKGYLIWICDNRTASGKGAQSTWPLYKNFGKSELQDIEDGLNWLKRNSWVDGARIGISGWSFGGYMTSYALTHSSSFKVGIAGGSVTDWRGYDSIYTERYMGTPQNNPEGYRTSSPALAAANLHGRILLIHGLTDDNVHVQNTIQFVHELQKAGKSFDLMLYPKSRHGVSDPALVKHMRTLMTEFILKNL